MVNNITVMKPACPGRFTTLGERVKYPSRNGPDPVARLDIFFNNYGICRVSSVSNILHLICKATESASH